MKSRLINLEAMTEALGPYLEQYLQEHGIDTSQNFRCINPEHEDNTPSMSCGGKDGNYVANCFACGCSAGIYQAAHYLEGKPLRGNQFIEENVLYLAKKFNVQVQLEDLTQEEIYEYRTYAAYKLASQFVSDPSFGNYANANKEIDRRGWDKDKVASWGIGTVNYKEFISKMNSAGYDDSFLNGIDLNRSNLFNNKNLLFTVYDDYGRPVGFSAKNLGHKRGDSASGPRYINTRGTGLECAIFKKGERLYGFDIAREAITPLYIFEGQADVITARHYGLMNCCCTLGTAITDHHVNLLKKHGIFSVILMFDGDAAGEQALQKALDEKFAKNKDFRIKLCQLPKGEDPDELLRNRGIDEFVRLKKWTAFEWRMTKFMEENQSEDDELNTEKRQEIAGKMAMLITSEPSYIRQQEMAKQVAKLTGYSLDTIIAEVKRLRDIKEADVHSKKRAVIEAMTYEVRKNPEEAEIALVEAQNALAAINKSTKQDDASNATLSKILSQKEFDEQRSGEFAGFFLKPYGLGGIGARLDDDWRTDSLFYIGGSEQAGKTTFSTQLMYEIADDPRNNAVCIYHSIDDAAKMILYKLLCNANGELKMKLNHLSNPNYWSNQPDMDWLINCREQAYRKIIEMVKDEKLILKDASDGSSLEYIDGLIKFYRQKYPSKNVVAFLDNFHKYPDYMNIQGHERVKRLSNKMKNMTTTNHVTICSTVEYRKLAAGEKPDNQAIAESRSLAYDSSVIIHLYNELHHKGENEAILIHNDEEGNVLPRIWVKFGKNKISGYEGREFLDLYGASGQYRAVDLETAIQDQKTRMEFLAENRPKGF